MGRELQDSRFGLEKNLRQLVVRHGAESAMFNDHAFGLAGGARCKDNEGSAIWSIAWCDKVCVACGKGVDEGLVDGQDVPDHAVEEPSMLRRHENNIGLYVLKDTKHTWHRVIRQKLNTDTTRSHDCKH
jgi:hypothetical protein